MKRLGTLAIVSLTFVTMFGSTALASRPSTSFVARANHAEQGGSLQVNARVKHGDRSVALGATAVVYFATGEVAVAMTQHGNALNMRVRVPVAADAALGPVAVDVTITYGATTQVVTTQGVIEPSDGDDDSGD